MRIGFLCADVDIPLLGDEGCSVKIREFLRALADDGHDVFIVCRWLGSGAAEDAGARTYELGPRGVDALAVEEAAGEPAVVAADLQRDLGSLAFNHWLLDQGPELLARERPDLLYECYSLFAWAGGELARRSGIPHLLEVNAPLCAEQDGYSKFTLPRTAARVEGEVFRRADCVIAVSEWLRGFVVSRGADPDRVHAIPNGVSRAFLPQADGSAVRAELGLGDARVCGYVGSFQEWHDMTGLVEAFAAVAADDPRARLLLVGDGPRRGAAEADAARCGLASRVTFAGNVDHDRVPEHVAAMDVAVVPYGEVSDFYFSPMKLFECMASGRVTVAASVGQIRDIVEDGRTGLLYSPGSRDGLRDALRVALAEPVRMGAIGAAAREQVLTGHTWTAVTRRVVDMGEGLLAGARA